MWYQMRAETRPAHIMRTGWFRQAHIKTEECYRIRLGKVGRGSMERPVRETVAGDAMTAGLMDCMLRARAALWEEFQTLHNLFKAGTAFGVR